jgi:signal transduction histidine kinase
VTGSDAATAVLIVGWPDGSPPCTQIDAVHFRVAAALLASGIDGFAGANMTPDLADAILGTLTDRIAVVDRYGAILAVNRAWTEFGERHGIGRRGVIGPGANYLEVCHHAAAAGCDEAKAALAGIEAVCSGSAESFSTAYRCGETGDDDTWCVMHVTSLRRPEGGAVIAHAQIAHAEMIQVARAIGVVEVRRLLDSVPLPIWVAAPDGRLLHGNEHWMDATRGHGAGPDNGHWTTAFHPGDRNQAAKAFHDAATRGVPFEIEARLMTVDGAYRWSACRAAPQYAADGSIASYVGACWDTSARRRMESSFRKLAAKLVAAQEAERSRIARDLHDDLGQQLAVLSLRLETLARDGSQPEMLKRDVAAAHAALQEIAAGVHALSHQLHPAKLRLLGLVQTLHTLCRDLSAKSGIRIRWRTRGVQPDVGEDVGLCVFRVAQEALRNAVKHSGATTIDVSLVATSSTITLRISDNGAGLDPLASPTAGLGLQTMRERVDLIGGVLSVKGVRPHGTAVRADIPLRRDPASDDDQSSAELTAAARANAAQASETRRPRNPVTDHDSR